MTEKKEQTTQPVPDKKNADELRFFPFAVAGVVCFSIAVMLGTGSWLVFGSRSRQITAGIGTASLPDPARPAETSVTPATSPLVEPSVAPTPEVVASPVQKFENVVEVPGGEIGLGGGDTGLPLQRTIVKEFLIGETEVTNAQYAEFIKASRRRPPAGWKESDFPDGTANFPVTNVSLSDAMEYCKWLGEKLGAIVRLPTEAEWEFAARGSDGRKYPWGPNWDKGAAFSQESRGKVSAVRTFQTNRSPFGAFDMAGNVWEWTSDKRDGDDGINDADVKRAIDTGKVLRIVKGGSAVIPASQISAQARFQIPENAKVATVGFRYVIEKPKSE